MATVALRFKRMRRKINAQLGSRRKQRVSKSPAGKGDAPRNNFSKKFQDNYEKIKWENRKAKKKIKKKKS